MQHDHSTDKLLTSPLQLDMEEYRVDLAEFELTEQQENELLATLFYMMKTFVDIGWGADTVQKFLPDLFEKAGSDSDNLVEVSKSKVFNQSAASDAEKVSP